MAGRVNFYHLTSPSDNICQNKWPKLTKVNTNFYNFPLRYKNPYLSRTDYANIVPHGTCNCFEIWLVSKLERNREFGGTGLLRCYGGQVITGYSLYVIH